MGESVEVTHDEADKEQFDASVVLGKKPGRYYRWARNEPKNLIMRRLDGYEVCRDPEVKSALGESTRMKKGEDVDDTITWGDMILVECSTENHEQYVERDRRKIVRRTNGVMASFRREIERAGGTPFEEHGRPAAAEGKGYDKGFSEEDMMRELGSAPEVEKVPAWRQRRE